ncbi:AAA family ATPase [Bacillus kwashiorkori]|uniref:AAA family ATPase n=1 Tax=Bacillus kwashiorkori TaxID=1522318 RepID=UPI0007818232|nr:AAA family ATPase [Bacillus kwashiorkori]
MKKIRTVFFDNDNAYLNSFINYVRTAQEGNKFELKLFTSEDNLHNFFKEKQTIDLLLVGSKKLAEQYAYQLNCVVINLESKRITEDHREFFSLYKYQPLNKLISNILAILYEQTKNITGVQVSNHTKVISIYSSSGGTGKTVTAVQLSRQLSLQNYKVFYLNLELYHSTQLFFQSPDDKHTSQILYYLKANPNQLMAKIETLKKKDARTNVEYFDMAVSAEEMMELSEGEVNNLIDCLKGTENYDYIIIDLESTVQPRIQAALNKSDYILWVVGADMQSFFKTKKMLEELGAIFSGQTTDFYTKSIFVINRYTGELNEELKKYNFDIHGFLPYVPEWNNLHTNIQLESIPFINEKIINLIKEQLEISRGVYNA